MSCVKNAQFEYITAQVFWWHLGTLDGWMDVSLYTKGSHIVEI
jgi:hypothetical protein